MTVPKYFMAASVLLFYSYLALLLYFGAPVLGQQLMGIGAGQKELRN